MLMLMMNKRLTRRSSLPLKAFPLGNARHLGISSETIPRVTRTFGHTKMACFLLTDVSPKIASS